MAGTKNLSALVSKSAGIRRELQGKTGAFDGTMPPQAVLDRIADETISGKFNTKRKNLCGGCFQYKSFNGTCGCDL